MADFKLKIGNGDASIDYQDEIYYSTSLIHNLQPVVEEAEVFQSYLE